jgi:hypothetical protein
MSRQAVAERAIPPQNLEAEISVLGAVLQDPGALLKAMDVLGPGDFYKEAHRKIFGACLNLLERNVPVDLVTLADELMRRQQLEDVGGPSYLASLVDAVPTAANVAYHARIVKDKARLRGARGILFENIERIGRDDADAASVVADIRQRLDALDTGQEARGYAPPAWPQLSNEALHGLAGEIIQAVEPYSEADPVGVLVHLLVAFGNIVGRGPHFRVESTRHGPNLFAVLVGPTAAGRKGQAWSSPRHLCSLTDEAWLKTCVKHGGLSSGEGLIHAVRDPTYKVEQQREKGRPTGQTQEVLADPGVEDKRLMVLESEFAQVLKVGTREGNILSPIMRQAWDGAEVLAPLTKTCPTRATGAHIAVVGHITQDELLRHLTETETANGWANRFLWFAVRRSKYLPDGTPPPQEMVRPLAERLAKAVAFGRGVQEIHRDTEATSLWRHVYRQLSEGRPGLVGAILGRAEAQTMRLACLYALLDCSFVIRKPHLLAALAVWDYVEESVRYIFGDRLGDSVADQALVAIREAGERGLTTTELHGAFGRNVKGGRLTAALQSLVGLGLVRQVSESGQGGRPATRWTAAKCPTKETK